MNTCNAQFGSGVDAQLPLPVQTDWTALGSQSGCFFLPLASDVSRQKETCQVNSGSLFQEPVRDPSGRNETSLQATEHRSDATRRLAAERVQRVINHMLDHVDQPLRISTLSALAGISDSHLHALFRHVIGHSPIEFFIRLRMRRACELLQQRKLVKEAADSVGYKDPFYFSRLFKSVVGSTPRDYRKAFLFPLEQKPDSRTAP